LEGRRGSDPGAVLQTCRHTLRLPGPLEAPRRPGRAPRQLASPLAVVAGWAGSQAVRGAPGPQRQQPAHWGPAPSRLDRPSRPRARGLRRAS